MILNEPQPDSIEGRIVASHVVAIRKWVRLLLDGNPFYIASAALLLFGINRLSIDPRFLSGEEAKLIFNFSALQVYELLLIGVVLFLAARRIFYDSTLLVVLESMVLLVPFILVTHAVMIGRGLALVLCGLSAGLVVLRFTALKNWFSELNLPGRALFLLGGLVFLNGATPLVFRHFVDTGGSDSWETPFKLGWLVGLPLIQLFALILPRKREEQAVAAGQRWLPFLFFMLWISGTAVHFWCMGYVADRQLSLSLLAPLLSVLCWTVYFRISDFGAEYQTVLRRILICAPILATFLAAGISDTRIFCGVACGNLLVFGGLALINRNREAGYLAIGSAALAVAGLPAEWAAQWLPDFSRLKCLELGIGTFVLICSAISRSPGTALCGAIMAGLAPGQFWPAISGHVCLETGLVFLLLHSLRWDTSKAGDRFRIATAATWSVHAFGWTYVDGPVSGWMVSSAAVVVLIAYLVSIYLGFGIKSSRVIPLAALFTICSWPLSRVIHFLENSPPGLIALTASFLFLAAGTWFAVSRKPFNSDIAHPGGSSH